MAEALADASKTKVSVRGNGWSMEIPKQVLSEAESTILASAKTLTEEEKAALPEFMKAILEGKNAYQLGLTDGKFEITFREDPIQVSMHYDLVDGVSPSWLKAFFLDEEGNPHDVPTTYDPESMCAVFTTNHFSIWYIDVIEPAPEGGGSSFGLIIAAAVVGITAVAAVVFFLMRSGKLGGSKGSA